MASLQACLQTNNEMSFSEPKQDPIIGLNSLCRSDTKLNEKRKLGNNPIFLSILNRFVFTVPKLLHCFVFSESGGLL